VALLSIGWCVGVNPATRLVTNPETNPFLFYSDAKAPASNEPATTAA